MNGVKFLSEDSKLISKNLNNLYYIANLDVCICDRMGITKDRGCGGRYAHPPKGWEGKKVVRR